MKKSYSKIKIFGTVLCVVLSIILTSCSIKSNEIHGTELLKLTDEELYEEVYSQTLDLVESYPDEETALSKINPEIKTIYILSIYDMEIQNGGLCQFFVNSSRSLAPYVDECLQAINAQTHKKLFYDFVTNNNIDLMHLDSFEIEDTDEYSAQTARYDFDAFDNAYYELTPLQDYMVSYIKNNISAF